MFIILVILLLILLAISWWVVGFGLYAILLLIPFFSFYSRKFGFYVKLSSITATEIILLFLLLTMQFIFRDIQLLKLLALLIVRGLSLCIVLYDDTAYVYVNEERKK